MVKEKGNFSAFKLFYDEIIYKTNSSVSYYSIDYNIKKIRSIVSKIRKSSRSNINYYNSKLKRYCKRIDYQLNRIYKLNRDLYEYYYLLYKAKVGKNSKLADLPSIISQSFSEDYSIKNVNDNASSVVPLFSSVEKKIIRDESKEVNALFNFIKLLEDSSNSFIYSRFVEKAKKILELKPLHYETRQDYIDRGTTFFSSIDYLSNRLERKARYTNDYEKICEYMKIAYKIDFDNWSDGVKEVILSFLESSYDKYKEENELKGTVSTVNDISYEEYRHISEELEREKEFLIASFETGSYVKPELTSKSYIDTFKNNLLKNYFDLRYKSKFMTRIKVEDFVERAIELYELASDLSDQIFERVMFDSSHSSSLKRNNDVNSAIILKIYDLYNPFYLLGIYNEAKIDFEELLNSSGKALISNYENMLESKKKELGYFGDIPSVEEIKENIIDRKKDFILEHCITDMMSIDLFENYDTRNYDLYIMAKDINNRELVELYGKIKDKIKNYDFSSMYFLSIDTEEERKDIKAMLYKAAQEFIVKTIYDNLELELINYNEIVDKYRDICFGFLNEQLFFIEEIEVKSDVNRLYEEYLRMRNEFKEVSNWSYFIKSNRL